MGYTFSNSEKTFVLRSADNATIPWDVTNNRPMDTGGATHRQWLRDGSPAPAAYVLPAAEFSRQVRTKRDTRLATGYADAVTGKTYQTDPDSLTRWTAIAANAGLALVMQVNPPPTFDIITADNSTITLTAQQAFDLFSKRVMPWVSATTFKGREKKDSYTEGQAVPDINTGWP